jgi:hypothetical protein
MKSLKKIFLSTLQVAAIAVVFFSCSNDKDLSINDTNGLDEADYGLEIVQDQNLPPQVIKQLTLSQENLEKYTNGALSLVSYKPKGVLSNSRGLEQTFRAISADNSTVGYGNIMDVSSLQIATVADISPAQKQKGIEILNQYATKAIKVGQKALELTWNYNGDIFKTTAFYDENGITWDNLMVGLTMTDQNPVVESDSTQGTGESARTYYKWSQTTWSVNWLWGSRRGSMYYKITIYYSSGYVSNTDIIDGASISLGSARSESRIIKNSGSYGKGQYALGLATPLASVSFNSSRFKVEASGLGSNEVHNGYKSLYP